MGIEKINDLYNYLNGNSGLEKRHPIKNDVLMESPEHIKNGYLKLLSVVMHFTDNVKNSQTNIFKRILEGAKAEKTAEEFSRMALDIEIDDVVKFVDELREMSLKYRWILDSLVMTYVDKDNSNQASLIANICELLDITKDELRYISSMAKAMISMKEEDIVTAYELKVDNIGNEIFYDYLDIIKPNCVMTNGNTTLLIARKKEDSNYDNIEKVFSSNTPCITMVGVDAVVDSSNSEKRVFSKISNKQKIIFEDCIFKQKNWHSYLEFERIQNLIIKDTLFYGGNYGSTNVIFFKNDKSEVYIDNCTFKNYAPCSNLFILCDESKFKINKSKFIDIRMTVYKMANIPTIVYNSYFENCKRKHDNDTLFDVHSEQFNCTFKDCNKFN